MSAATSPFRRLTLTIGTKIGLIVGLMLVPFGLMTWLYLAQVQKDVSFSAAEQLGTTAIGPVWSLLAQAARADAGPAALAERAREVQAQAADDERDFKAGEAVNALLDAVSAKKPAADVLEAAKAAITKVADGSNLTLDPDVDSYYLMDAVTVRLPEAAAALADLRAAAAPALREGQNGSKVLIETVRARTRFAAAIANAESSLASAIGGSPDGSVGRALDPQLKRLTAAGDAFAARADAVIAKLGEGQDDATDKDGFAQADAAALAEVGATWNQARGELDRLLANRVDGFKSGAMTKLGFTALCLLLVAFATVMVVRSVRKPLADLIATIRRFQTGEYNFEVPHAEARNESGEIARALKRFQELGAQQSLTMNALDGSATLLMITDPDEKIVFMSGALTRLFMELEPAFRAARHDFSVEKMFGQHIDYYSSNPELKYQPLLDDGHTRKARLSIGGKVIDLDMSYIRAADGSRIGHTMLWRDVTAELRAEHEVEQVVSAAAEGDFSKRLTVDAKMGFIAHVAAGLNAVSDQVEQALGDLGTLVTGLAEGDLTRTVKRAYKGRFGQLFTDLNAAVERLAETVDHMQRTAAEVEDAAQRINVGADNLAQRTEEQAASLEETAATTEELAASVRQSAEASRRAVELAADAAQVAANGGSIVRDAVEAMSRIEQGSQKISDITSVIDEIAFQTNLLALNAAVEAARAGDAGKGFAVVASEVRTLAQRSSEAAKDITALIGASHDEVSTGVRLVKEAGAVLGKILEANGGVSAIINDVSTATAEQANGIHEVSHAVAHMDEITQQNATLADESAAGAADLSTQVAALNRLVSAFETGRRLVQAQGQAAAQARVPVAASARVAAPRPTPSPAAKPAPHRSAAKPAAKPAARSVAPASRTATARVPSSAATTSEPDRLRKLAAEAFTAPKPSAQPAPAAAGWEEF